MAAIFAQAACSCRYRRDTCRRCDPTGGHQKIEEGQCSKRRKIRWFIVNNEFVVDVHCGPRARREVPLIVVSHSFQAPHSLKLEPCQSEMTATVAGSTELYRFLDEQQRPFYVEKTSILPSGKLVFAVPPELCMSRRHSFTHPRVARCSESTSPFPPTYTLQTRRQEMLPESQSRTSQPAANLFQRKCETPG